MCPWKGMFINMCLVDMGGCVGVLVGSGDPKFLDIQSQHAAIKALKNMRNRQIGSSSHLFGNKIKHVPKHQPAINDTSSTAQGGGGSFKNRKPIGEVGCCESGMAERSHWWSERWLISLTISLSFSDYLSIYLSNLILSYLILSYLILSYPI